MEFEDRRIWVIGGIAVTVILGICLIGIIVAVLVLGGDEDDEPVQSFLNPTATLNFVTPTPGVTPTPQPTGQVTNTDNLNVREGPSTAFERLAQLPRGTSVTLTGRNSESTWLQIQLNNQNGWVSAEYINSSTSVSSLPVASSPNPPAGNTGSDTDDDTTTVTWGIERIFPNAGTAGTSVSVDIFGFPVNSTASLRLGSSLSNITDTGYASATVNANGRASMTFNMPEFWPDNARITNTFLYVVVVNNQNSQFGWAGFTYTPVDPPELDPEVVIGYDLPNVGAGTLITVTASEFPANTAVSVRIGRTASEISTQTYATATTSNTGGAIMNFALPATWPTGEVITASQIFVTVITNDGSVFETVPVTYGVAFNPVVALSPNIGTVGTIVAVAGSDFPPSDNITITISQGSNALQIVGASTDANGDLVTSFAMPSEIGGAALVDGAVFITATDSDSFFSAEAAFTYTAPVTTDGGTTDGGTTDGGTTDGGTTDGGTTDGGS